MDNIQYQQHTQGKSCMQFTFNELHNQQAFITQWKIMFLFTVAIFVCLLLIDGLMFNNWGGLLTKVDIISMCLLCNISARKHYQMVT